MTTATRREMQIEHVDIESLRPDPANPRKIADAELEALTRSLREWGFVQPVLVRRNDNTVVGGHQRLVAARRFGLKTVPVIFVDLSLEQARLLNLALNKISGDWDDELLARLVADLQPLDAIDLSLSGFAPDELNKLMKSLELREKRDKPEAFDVEAALEAARAATRAQRGELWAMGDHRLLVGDATDAGAVSRLLGGDRPAMAFTDPPYNVALGDHGGQQPGQRKRRIQNDAMPPEQWIAFVRGWSKNLIDSVDGAVLVCMSTKEWASVSQALADAGGHWSDTIIWKKDRFVMGRADYQRQYEPIWYGWREGAKHHWCGDRDQGDVWEIARPSESEAHPTMKPLPLVERAINNSSKPGDVVLDLFLGSGSTLIAAERTGRVCYGMDGLAVGKPGGSLAGSLIVNRNDGVISRVDLTQSPASVSTFASGGTRGDFVAVSPDGYLFATQTDVIVKFSPASFQVSVGGTPSSLPLKVYSGFIVAGLLAAIVMASAAWRRRLAIRRHQLAVVAANPTEVEIPGTLALARTIVGVGGADATGRLIEQLEEGTTRTHEIGDGSLSIGAASECSIKVAKTEGVAAYHARVSFRQGRYTLHHTGGPNFVTIVGGERVEWVRLDNGDEIRVGAHRFVFEEPKSSA